jgi:hypothetical protein
MGAFVKMQNLDRVFFFRWYVPIACLVLLGGLLCSALDGVLFVWSWRDAAALALGFALVTVLAWLATTPQTQTRSAETSRRKDGAR